MFAILDVAPALTADDVVAYVAGVGGIEGRSEFGAVYWPRVRVTNPSPRALGPAEDLIVPPSGHIAGVYARTDGARPGGVYEAPAGVDIGRLAGVLGAEMDEVLDENARDLVFPHRVNPIRGRYIDGARTLKATGNFPSVPERRGVIYIARSLALGLDRVRHRSNTPELRAEVYRAVFQFLLSQMNIGAFATRDPRTAFFVDVSDALNPPSSVLDGQLRLRVGLATAKPAEFVIVELSQDLRALDAELANAEA
ncbi:MAG: phage tail sheath family protein [Kofleriaceae bacterium]|nr:phage tail sheath family protein [Kofleriaceae bacterium]